MTSSWPSTMRWRLLDGRFALLGFPEPALHEDYELLLDARCGELLVEPDETTLLVPEDRSAEVLARHPEARIERGLAWIRFETAMAWDVVGFLARVCSALAAEEVPVGAICGFSRDSVFVAERHLATTSRVLDGLFPRAR